MRSLQIFSATTALFLAMIHQAMCTTIWVDDRSCTGPKDMKRTIEETLSMADKARARLESPSDTDFASVFKQIFRVDKTNSASYKAVHDFMKDTAGATMTSDRNSANVRIYCDQEARFVQRVDPKTKQKVGGFEDKDNWIIHPTKFNFERMPCFHETKGERNAMAVTYKKPMDGDPPEKQNPVRSTVTMCDQSFFYDKEATQPRKGLLMGDIKDKVDLKRITEIDPYVNRLTGQTSKILLHEFGHTLPWNLLDTKYYWSGVQECTPDEAKENADSYALLGQFALLAERGYTIPRIPPDKSPKEEVDAVNDQRTKGQLAKYENLTKRSLKRRLNRLARLARRTGPQVETRDSTPPLPVIGT